MTLTIDPITNVAIEVAEADLIGVLGAFSGSISPPGVAASLLVSIPFRATAAGTSQFSTDPADNLPSNDAGLYGVDDKVTDDQISFGSTVLQIAAAASAEGESNGLAAFAEDADALFAAEGDWLTN